MSSIWTRYSRTGDVFVTEHQDGKPHLDALKASVSKLSGLLRQLAFGIEGLYAEPPDCNNDDAYAAATVDLQQLQDKLEASVCSFDCVLIHRFLDACGGEPEELIKVLAQCDNKTVRMLLLFRPVPARIEGAIFGSVRETGLMRVVKYHKGVEKLDVLVREWNRASEHGKYPLSMMLDVVDDDGDTALVHAVRMYKRMRHSPLGSKCSDKVRHTLSEVVTTLLRLGADVNLHGDASPLLLMAATK